MADKTLHFQGDLHLQERNGEWYIENRETGNLSGPLNLGSIDVQSILIGSSPEVSDVTGPNLSVDANGVLSATDTDTNTFALSRNLQPEGSQTGLAADSTGVKYEGGVRQQIDSSVLNGSSGVYIEAAKNSSAGDEVVDVEVYDDTAAAVVDSLSIAGGSPRSRSADVSGSLTSGNEVHVRYNVTTASTTGGATFDAINSRLIVE